MLHDAYTIKGVDLYRHSDEIEFDVVVADAGEFEFLLEYISHDGYDEHYTFELLEMAFR